MAHEMKSAGKQLNRLELRPLLLALALMTAAYIPTVLMTGSRPFWHDELFTVYLSGFPDLHTLIENIRKVDLNPPLIYLVTRAFTWLYGTSEFVVRLPEIIAFWIASASVLAFTARRLGAFYGLLAVFVFWYAHSLPFATEARPYALLLMFFGLAMLCWQEAVATGAHRRLALTLLPFCLAGMIASHVFSVFYFLPFACAEAARLWQRKKLDVALYAGFIAPAFLTGFYIPIVNRYGTVIFPDEFAAGPRKILHFFKMWVEGVGPELTLATMAVLLLMICLRRPVDSSEVKPKPSPAELGLAAGLLLLPLVINLVLMRSHAAFWPRYAVGSAIALSISASWIIQRLARANPWAAILAAVIVFAVANLRPALQYSTSTVVFASPARLETVEPGLPFVTASGLAFLELDHYASNGLASRLYYLTDHTAAAQIAHATLFERMADLKQLFPVRSNVSPYSDFIRRHQRFLVLGIPNYPEDWLIKKLQLDGARLTSLEKFHTLGDDMDLFQVEIR